MTIAAPEEVAETLFTSFLCGNAFSAPAALFLEDKVNQNFDTKLSRQVSSLWSQLPIWEVGLSFVLGVYCFSGFLGFEASISHLHLTLDFVCYT